MKIFVAVLGLALAATPVLVHAQDGMGPTGGSLPPTGAGGAAGDDAAVTDSRMPVWPWVVGGLGATAAGIAAFAGGDGRGKGGSSTTTTTGTN